MTTTQNDFDTLENATFILKGRLTAPTHFVEGFTQLSFGTSFAKILFHNVIEHKTAEAPELRRAEQYLTLPTVLAIELAHLLLLTAKHAQAHVLSGLNAAEQEKIRSILRDFQPVTPEQELARDEVVLMTDLEKNKLN
ncbi:MAG: hypothetical protein Q8M66_03890 [Actinomycetota bacterium]|nr:hypothetical protein [Actinomycetota bacterium]MDZ4200627.1 hypothetical protein [Gallionella sp.]